MLKVRFFNKEIIKLFSVIFSAISAIVGFIIMFGWFDSFFETHKKPIGIATAILLIIIYLCLWIQASILRKIKLKIDGCEVIIKVGDIFKQKEYKVIAFNEYFDTTVDDKIIAARSLNGIFIQEHMKLSVEELNKLITQSIDKEYIIEKNVKRRKGGKSTKYKSGTSVALTNEDFIITAFSKFDKDDRAVLTMTEYFNFLITFWDKINVLYSQKSVSVPIFGSGITRIKEHKNISDEDLLKIMLWTFKLSEYRFRYPAKLTIVIHEDKIKNVNLFDLKSLEKGF